MIGKTVIVAFIDVVFQGLWANMLQNDKSKRKMMKELNELKISLEDEAAL